MMIHTQPDSPLHQPLKSHQAHTLIAHLQQGEHLALLNQVDRNGLTALQIAASFGMIEALLWLSYAGADIHACQASHEADHRLSNAQKPALYLYPSHLKLRRV